MGANVLHDGRISRVVRSRIFDDREICVMGARRAHLSRRTITYLRRSREMCYGCECLARRAHLRIVRRTLCSREWSGSSRIEDAGLVADVSMQDSQSKGGRKCLILASYDHVSSTSRSREMCYGCECLARRAHLSRRTITNLRRSREMCYGCECLARRAHLSRRTITNLRRSREMCYGCECLARRAHLSRRTITYLRRSREMCYGCEFSHDGRISGSSVAHCAHASGVGHLASKTQVSSPTSRCRIVRAKAEESV